MKGGDLEGAQPSSGARTISLGTSVLIPESYVADLQLRLGLYRRLSTLETRERDRRLRRRAGRPLRARCPRRSSICST